jgi:hypothetical protein
MLDLTSFNPMIKEHYAPMPVINMAAQNNKALGLLTKRNRKASGDGGGKYWVQPIQYADPGGGSVDFTTANAYTDNESQYAAFQVTRKKHYRISKVDNETIEATASGNIDAFEPAFDEFDKAMRAEGNYLNFRFFRSSSGAIGRMSNTGFATAVLTLDDPAGCWGVRRNDVLQLSADSGATVKAGTIKVASVQRRAGTITLTGNISAGVATAAANDYVALKGDFSGSATGASAAGMIDWAPDAAPAATSFFGVDRSTDDMLGGLRIDATDGRPVHEALIDSVSALDEYGADPDVCFANPRALATLTKQLEGKWVIMKGQGYGGQEADIGYRGWQVTIEGHEVTVFSDRCCQVSRMWVTQLDTWTLFSAGMAPNFITKRAGSIIKISETADAYEARVGEYYNYSNKAPSYTCNVQLA